MLDYVGLLSAGNEEMVTWVHVGDGEFCADECRHDLPGKLLPVGNNDMKVRQKRKRRKRRCSNFSQVLSLTIQLFS